MGYGDLPSGIGLAASINNEMGGGGSLSNLFNHELKRKKFKKRSFLVGVHVYLVICLCRDPPEKPRILE